MESTMGGVIEITEHQWACLHQRLMQDYQHEPSVVLIRAKMRSVLGFTDRRHQRWPQDRVTMVPEVVICLDFFDPALQAWFLLRYGEYVDG